MDAERFPRIVVMGVAGSGKTTVGTVLSERLGALFVDADDLHSAEAVAKMAAGQSLSDGDRYPWLDRVGRRLGETDEVTTGVVVACSALRRTYRDRLRKASKLPLFFVHLTGDADVLAHRMRERGAHFMPVSLLQSQLDTLEPLEADEDGVSISISAHPDEIAQEVAFDLASRGSAVSAG